MKLLHLGSNGKKNSEKDLNKIETRLVKRKWKMYSLKIRLQKC